MYQVIETLHLSSADPPKRTTLERVRYGPAGLPNCIAARLRIIDQWRKSQRYPALAPLLEIEYADDLSPLAVTEYHQHDTTVLAWRYEIVPAPQPAQEV